jgi:hypothetical protein
METLDKILPRALLVVSAGLLCWGLLGLLEYAFPALGLGLQNNGFPDGLQFLHFFAIALTVRRETGGCGLRRSHSPR